MASRLVIIENTKNNNKRLVALYTDHESNVHKKIYFGLKNSNGTYYDIKDDIKKENYIKRHRANENWNDPYTAGWLSRYVLWSEYSKVKLIKLLKTKLKSHGIKHITLNFKKYLFL